MSADILQFPRRKPLEDHEYPAHWGYMEKTYYEMRIEDGVSHEDAFAEWDKHARKRQADHELYRRLCDEADARRARERDGADRERKQARAAAKKREG